MAFTRVMVVGEERKEQRCHNLWKKSQQRVDDCIGLQGKMGLQNTPRVSDLCDLIDVASIH